MYTRQYNLPMVCENSTLYVYQTVQSSYGMRKLYFVCIPDSTVYLWYEKTLFFMYTRQNNLPMVWKNSTLYVYQTVQSIYGMRKLYFVCIPDSTVYLWYEKTLFFMYTRQNNLPMVWKNSTLYVYQTVQSIYGMRKLYLCLHFYLPNTIGLVVPVSVTMS